jgi:hypothetical protein
MYKSCTYRNRYKSRLKIGYRKSNYHYKKRSKNQALEFREFIKDDLYLYNQRVETTMKYKR